MGLWKGWNPFKREKIIREDLALYVQDLTGVKVEDLCEEESGEVRESPSEDWAEICLKLREGGSGEIQKRMQEQGRETPEGDYTIPGYSGSELAVKLKGEELIARYDFFFKGKGGAKTRSVEVYLSKDSEGNGYLYLFG